MQGGAVISANGRFVDKKQALAMTEAKRNIIVVLIGMVSAMLIFSACGIDGNDITAGSAQSTVNATIGTFLKESDTSYYIDSDRGNKLYVTNYTDLLDDGYASGQRVYAEFVGTVAKAPFVGSVKVTYAYPVLVKQIAAVGNAAADDPVDALRIWNSRNFLNIQYIIKTSGTYIHSLDLVTVDSPKKQEDGYRYLELRHSLNGNTALTNFVGIASFDISKYLADSSVKGFIIRYKSLSGKEMFAQCDLARNNSDVMLETEPNAEMGSALLVK